ncbi:MAG TPA: DUF6152 family protein [Candidatus Nitrosotalea sp.]|nr:DUF6152 family protein [Candidatus Nitrosotalea sp.]
MRKIAFLLLGLGVSVAPVLAHHSAAAEYDINKSVSIQGTITKVDWLNPHIRIYVDVKGADGKVVNWEIESGGPGAFLRAGFTRNSLKIGDPITVKGYPAKDGENLVDATDITLADGRKMNSSPSDGK